ncbi:hypothetical protein [Geobacter pickeringii]|uniref:3-keto-disaccharide hydrolase domain-containing protein n=1 Tax=Geobacter pickeringii TaxID=345632 RepID=A0A0B5BB59_9BACT|nr:hypothetical protein [Geobacter pickeringii]AJE04013.1 hypothetical protein GPICK_12185 [Geobacter pickeringii]
MNLNCVSKIAAALLMLGMTVLPANAGGERAFDFSKDTGGRETREFVPLVGIWHADRDGARTVYAADGRNWEQGLMAPGAREKARELFGDRHAEFIAGLENYRYFPLSVCRGIKTFRNGSIELSFKAAEGRIDQAAGIAFNIRPNGNYLVVRANALENNLVLFGMAEGRRSSLAWVRNVPTPSNRWHTLKVVVSGKRIEAYLNGTRYIDTTWREEIDGRIGLWSKADSYTLFGSLTVTPQ